MNDNLDFLRDANPVPPGAFDNDSRGAEGLALLTRIVDTAPEPQRRDRRPLVLAGVGAAAVAAGVLCAGLVASNHGGNAPPAAQGGSGTVVRLASDGTLTVTVNNFSGSWGLNTDLDQYGVKATIKEAERPVGGCTVPPGAAFALPADAIVQVASNSVAIKPNEIPADATLVFGRLDKTSTPPTIRVFAVRTGVADALDCPAVDGGATPAITTIPVVNPNAVNNSDNANANGVTGVDGAPPPPVVAGPTR